MTRNICCLLLWGFVCFVFVVVFVVVFVIEYNSENKLCKVEPERTNSVYSAL